MSIRLIIEKDITNHMLKPVIGMFDRICLKRYTPQTIYPQNNIPPKQYTPPPQTIYPQKELIEDNRRHYG